MILTTLVAYAAMAAQPAMRDDTISRIQVTITTGADDMRSDSAGMVVLQYSDSRHQIAPLKGASESLGSNSSKTLTLTPNVPNLKLTDLYHVRVDFSSGTATGYNDKWTLDGVKVVATMGRNEVTLYNRQHMGMHLQESQHWTSTPFDASSLSDVVNPANFWVELDGVEGQNSNTQFIMDLEADDGRAWSGKRSAAMIQDHGYPGVRAEAQTQEKVAVKSIRTFRIGYGKTFSTASDRTAAGSPGGHFTIRTARVYYRTSDTAAPQEYCTFNEVNFRFADGGWWQAPIMKRYKREPGFPIQALQIEYLSGGDDLRRMSFSNPDQEVCNSRLETTFTVPIVPLPGRNFCDWIVHGDWVRSVMHHTQPMVMQDGDEFPQGWTGTFASYGRFEKTFRAVGTPYLMSSDLASLLVTFKRGAGGDFHSGGGALDNLLRQPDDWDLAGIIVSAGGPDHPMRRLYSNFTINQHMNRMDQTWKSPNFETLQLRRAP
ncbi:MAG: hypothetical protein JST51_13575 [Armatimonadetes bacterium]|nr:hypothetical protein [Armatimonadota bacterium]